MAGAKNPEERLNNLLSARLALLEALKTASTKYADIVSDTTDESEDHNKQLKDAAEAVNKLKKQYNGVRNAIKEINEEASTLVEGFKTAGDSIGSLSSLQDEFKNKLTKTALEGVVLSREIRSIGGETKESFKQALEQSSGLIETIAELANLNKEDALAIASKNEEFATKFSDLSTISKELTLNAAKGTEAEKQRAAAIASIVTELEEANKEASTFNNIDKEHGEFLKELNEDYHEIGKTFKKIGYTAETIFGSKRGFLGMALIGAGMLAEKFGELGKKIGVGMTEMVGLKTQVGLVGAILGEEAGEAALDLAKDLGDSHHLTTSMAVDAGLLAANYDLSAKQAAFMSVAFGELSGKSYETGKNTGEFVKQLAISNGVAPSQVMKDVADNTEFFALYSKDGGQNIGEAAVAAAKLGVGLDVAAKVANHLLDYQTSVSDEMEASVLLGRDVNLGKARQLMYDGKIAEGMQAGLEAAGGINEYNKMDYYQRQALAKALGVSNTELQQMVAHEETLKGMHGVANKLYSQSSDLLQYMGNTLTGKVLKGMGGLVLSGAQFGAHLSQMGIKIPMLTNALKFMMSPVKGIANGFMNVVSWIGKAIAKMLGFKAVAATTNIGADALTSGTSMAAGGIPKGGRKKARFLKGLKNTAAVAPSVSTPPVENLTPPKTPKGPPGQSMLSKFGSAGQIAAMAAVLIAFAAAIFILSKAFQNFAEIPGEKIGQTIGLFTVAIVGMVATLGILSLFTPLMWPMVAAMVAFGAAVMLMGVGVNLAATGLSTLVTSFKGIDLNAAAAMMAFGASLYFIASALGVLAVAGLAAMPILAALAIGGGIAVALGLGGAGGKKDDPTQKLLDEIVGLRGDLNSGKVGVFLDGVKVNTILAQAGKNTITNN